MLQDPIFTRGDRYYLTAEESFDWAAEMSAQYMRIKKKHGILNEEQGAALKALVICSLSACYNNYYTLILIKQDH